MKILAKIIAFLIVLILLIALPLSILLYNVGQVVFNPPLVKEVLTENLVTSDLVPAGLQWFSEQRTQQRYADKTAIVWQDEPDIIDLLSFVDISGWQIIREEVLPDEILEEWISVSVDGTYAWLDSEDRVPDISWNMHPFKEQVRSEHGANAIQLVYEALLPCSDDEVADFKSRLAAATPGSEVLYNLCQFPEAFGEDQVSDYHDSLILVVDSIPDTFSLTNELENLGDTQGVSPLAVKAQLLFLRTLMRLAPIIPVVLLLLILALAVRSLDELGRWWGIPLTIGGVLLLILAILYRPTVISIMSFGPMNEVPILVREEAIKGVMQLAAEIFRPTMWQSVVPIFLGLLLIVVGFVLEPNPNPDQDSAV